jgi:cation:H+ antiporter
LGISSVINPLPFNPSANTDVLMTIFVSVLLFAFLFFNKKREIARWMGGSMIFIYVSYLVYLIIRG